jgi:hypothetical protein
MPEKKPVILAEQERKKPIGVLAETGSFVTLAEYHPQLEGKLAFLPSLDKDTRAKFTVSRLLVEPPDLHIGILTPSGEQRELSRDELIKEIEMGSPIGRQFIEIEQAWIERVKEKVRKGEYHLHAEEPFATAR